MNTSPEILASQQAYAARPYAVRIQTSHFSGTSRFDTLVEAIGYLTSQYVRMKAVVKAERCRSFDAQRSELILPGDVRVACCEFIGSDLSSY